MSSIRENTLCGKPTSASQVSLTRQMQPEDANVSGNVQGGVILQIIDNAAASAAMRHAGCRVVTARVDRLDFLAPVYPGDVLMVLAQPNYTGSSSMEIGIRVQAENPLTGDVRHTCSAYLTMVAIGEDGRPKRVPPLIAETAEDKRRQREALERKQIRAQERARLNA